MKKYKFIFISICLGIVVGMATVFGQKYLSGTFNSLANSGSIWVVVAFYLASIYREKWKSVLSSILYLLICVMTYYGYYSVIWNTGFSVSFHQIVWLCCAIIFGFVFGMGGNLSKYGNGRIKYICKTLLPAVFLSESLSLILHFQEYTHMIGVMIMWVVMSAIMYFINCKDIWRSKECLMALTITTMLGFLGYQLIYYIDKLALIY